MQAQSKWHFSFQLNPQYHLHKHSWRNGKQSAQIAAQIAQIWAESNNVDAIVIAESGTLSIK